MRGKRVILAVLLCALLCPVTVWGEAVFSCALQADGTVWITAWNGTGSEVTVPETLDGRPVSGIGDGVFRDRTSLTVNLPAGLTHFGAEAFGTVFSRVKRIRCALESETARHLTMSFCPYEAPSVALIWQSGVLCLRGVDEEATEVTVPDGVEKVIANALYRHPTLRRIVLPESVTEIGQEAFYGSSLLTVVLPGGVRTIGTGAFGNFGSGAVAGVVCDPLSGTAQLLTGLTFFAPGNETCRLTWTGGELVLLRVQGEGPYHIHPAVDRIADEAVAAMPVMTVPEDTQVIGPEAFRACGANRLYVPDSVTEIGSAAFADCPDLVRIRLPGGLADLPDGLLDGSPHVTVITPAGSETAAWCARNGIPTADE